jgi:hypothetical protein
MLVLDTAESSLSKEEGSWEDSNRMWWCWPGFYKKAGYADSFLLTLSHKNKIFVSSPCLFSTTGPLDGLSKESLNDYVKDSWLKAICSQLQAI